MRVLVTGGRDMWDAIKLTKHLDEIHKERPIDMIGQGGAFGADMLARRWAAANRIKCMEYKAQWERHGAKAGPMRNEFMLKDFKPDLVLAFPGGRGTADLIRRARQQKGLEVIVTM